jgi:hypothetical protein
MTDYGRAFTIALALDVLVRQPRVDAARTRERAQAPRI